MGKILRIGLAGCGRIARYAHLPCYRHISNAKVVAVMDSIPERAKLVAREFHIEKWYGSYTSMLQDDNIDAIDICSPPTSHSENAILASESGKHILSEKPVAINLEEARELETKVKKSGVFFMTGFTYRFHPLLEKVRQEIHKPNLLRVSYSFRPNVQPEDWVHSFNKEGGFLIEQAVHWFDLFSWWIGPARSVYAKEKSNYPFQNTVALVSYDNDALGLVDYNSNSAIKFFNLTIENADKSAIVRMGLLPTKFGGSLEIKETGGRRRTYMLGYWGIKQTSKKSWSPIPFISSKLTDSHLVPFYREISHFVDSVLSNSVPRVSLSEGIDALKVACAAKESSSLDREVSL